MTPALYKAENQFLLPRAEEERDEGKEGESYTVFSSSHVSKDTVFKSQGPSPPESSFINSKFSTNIKPELGDFDTELRTRKKEYI